ncbi:MFS transporter [Streptacidiphilus albus]|uniref:MFS transporter n=1 Tax=Streptacidiphilus albus TaxID=105425 RepID=UPI0005AA1C16|nr:MFS transporter [Streptacidiphilus albus]
MTAPVRAGTPSGPGAADPVRTRRAAWRTTWLLLGFMLINFADKTVLGLAATPMMQDLGITHAQYGEASSAFFALFSLSALGVSVLAKRVRSSTLLLLMALLWSAAQLPLLANVGFGVLVATRVLLGAAEGPAFPVAVHSLFSWFPDRERTLPVSVLTLGAAAGVAVSAPLLTAVIDDLGWHWAFGLVGLVGLAWAACWARFGAEGPEPVLTAPAPPAAEGTPDVPLRRILLTGTWIAAALGCFAAYWQLSSGLTWTADYLEKGLGVSTRETGVLIMGAGLTSASVLLGYGFLAQRLRRRGASLRRVALFCGAAMVVSGGSVAAFGTTSSLPLKIALMLGPMTLCNVVLAMAQTACARIAPPRQRGVVLGSLAFVYSLAGVLSPLVVGRLTTGTAHLVDGYRTGYLVTAVLVTGAGLVALVLLRPERDAARLGLPVDPTAGPALPG